MRLRRPKGGFRRRARDALGELEPGSHTKFTEILGANTENCVRLFLDKTYWRRKRRQNKAA